jgi:hypothetical protein
MEDDLIIATTLILDATAGIAPQYFHLPVAGVETPKYRERVYCYELYHQIRKRWPTAWQNSYSLGGEVDKGGNPATRGNVLDRTKPDFIFHIPGHEINLLVVEVKPGNIARKGADPLELISADLKKLTAFTKIGRYLSAIYLIYGGSEGGKNDIIKQCVIAATAQPHEIELGRVQFVWHPKASSRAFPVTWE